MRLRTTSLFALALIATLASCTFAADKKNPRSEPTGADGQFTDTLSTAVDQSKSSGKLIMLDFTGSDWCGFCIKLKEQVFDTKDFKDWASKSLLLVEVDFPNSKTLSKAVKEQNDQLKEKYKPGGFPTIVFVTADGTEVGRMVGYGSDPKAWSKEAQDIVKKNPNAGKTASKTK